MVVVVAPCVLADLFALVLAHVLALLWHSIAVHPNSTLHFIPLVGSALSTCCMDSPVLCLRAMLRFFLGVTPRASQRMIKQAHA
jgi:hypothetical protein